MKNLLFALILSTGLPFVVQAQPTPEEQIQAFAERLIGEGAQAAIDSLFASNPWLTRDVDSRTQIATQLSNVLPLVGTYRGTEVITSRFAGRSLVLYSYLFKFDRQPLRINFMFYKPQDMWMLYRFKYDDDFDVELEEATKLYLLNF